MHGFTPSHIPIPQELVYHIVDLCHDDVPTLQSCALVSRHWVTMAQRHLLSSITLQDHLPERNFSSFLVYLTDYPSTCAHIRHLRITRGRLTLTELFAVIQRLTSLHTLSIDTVEILPFTSSSHTSLSKGLESLDIMGCIITEVDEPWRSLFDLIRIFPSVTQLCLDNLWGGDLGNDLVVFRPLSSSSHQTRVHTLLFSPFPDEFEKEFIDYTIESIDVENLVSLYYTPWLDNGAQRRPVQTVFDVARKLKSFRLDMVDLGVPLPPFSLALCHSLEVMEFSISYYRGWEQGFRRFNYELTVALTILLSLPAASVLSTVKFQIHLHSMTRCPDFSLDGVEWFKLEHALGRFKELTTLDIALLVTRELAPSASSTDLLAIIKRDLAGLTRRCALQLAWQPIN